jgi:hypothetical protein
MAHGKAQLAALVVAAACIAPSESRAADPESLACIQAAESGQAARDHGEFLKAREILATCTAPECPGIIRRDCSGWLEDVRARTPTIIVVARDANGRDVAAAKLTVDGVPHSLDGSAIEIDPGAHVVRVEGAGTAEERIVVSAGEKGRAVALIIDQKPAAGAPRPPDQPKPPEEGPHVPVGSFLLAGLGVAGFAVFGVYGEMGLSDADHLRNTCAPGCQPSDVDAAHTKLIVADVALGVGIVALAAATWIAVRGLSSHRANAAADVLKYLSAGQPSGAAIQIAF